jgi:hypothetical protein
MAVSESRRCDRQHHSYSLFQNHGGVIVMFQNHGGVIVNITATLDYRGTGFQAHAGSAKAAIGTVR